MIFYSDDPLADFERSEREHEKWVKTLPVCADCDEPIQDESAYYINGEWICERCMGAYRQVVIPE